MHPTTPQQARAEFQRELSMFQLRMAQRLQDVKRFDIDAQAVLDLEVAVDVFEKLLVLNIQQNWTERASDESADETDPTQS